MSQKRLPKWHQHFRQSTYLQTTNFQYSKNFGSPTRVTRLEVALKMIDPISLKKTEEQEKGWGCFVFVVVVFFLFVCFVFVFSY